MRRPCIHACISVTAVCFCRTSDCVRLLQRQPNVTPSTFRESEGVSAELQQYLPTVRGGNRTGLAEPRHSLYSAARELTTHSTEWCYSALL